jgi:hypothetical protein
MAVLKERKRNLRPLPRIRWIFQKGLWYNLPTGKIIDADRTTQKLICRKPQRWFHVE